MADLIDSIDKINETPPSEVDAKKVGKGEERALEETLEYDRKREEIRGLTQDIDERKKYAEKSFKLLSLWLTGVFVLLLLQGFLSQRSFVSNGVDIFDFSFKLSDSVLLAVVSGTTVSVIGIFLVVANYLFPKR